MTRPAPIPASDLVQFAIVPPDTAVLGIGANVQDIAISPDGTQVVYGGNHSGGRQQIYLRRLDQLDSAPLRAAEGGAGPFISPDCEWVGFTDTQGGSELLKVSILGGPPVTLFEFPSQILGASWETDDRIIVGASGAGLFRVSAGGGGEAETLTTPDTEQGETTHVWPFIIPDRQAVLFVIAEGLPVSTTGQLAVLDLATGDVTRLGLMGVSPRYASTGHLLFAVEDGSVRAVPFDIASLNITGSLVPVLDGVTVKSSGAANFSVSDTGSLAHVNSRRESNNRLLALVDRNGAVEALNVPPAPYVAPRLSPDGDKLVVETAEDDGNVLSLYDLAGDAQIQQLTFDGDNQRPIWTPDGQRITFSSDREGTMSLYSMPADGSGAAERLTTADEGTFHWAGSWASDGQTLLFNVERELLTDWDIWYAVGQRSRDTESLRHARHSLCWCGTFAEWSVAGLRIGASSPGGRHLCRAIPTDWIEAQDFAKWGVFPSLVA